MNESLLPKPLAPGSYLPGVISLVVSLAGICAFGWCVGDIFFWHWAETMLALVWVNWLTFHWRRQQPARSVSHWLFEAVFGGAVILGLTTLICLLGCSADYKREQLWGLFHTRRAELIVLAAAFAWSAWRIKRGPEFAKLVKNTLERPLISRAMPIVMVYAAMIFYGHATSSTKLDITHGYTQGLAIVLVLGKFAYDIWPLRSAMKAS
jgi:hypothetical protein